METQTEKKQVATVKDIKDCAKDARSAESLEWMLYKYSNIYGDTLEKMEIRLKSGVYRMVLDYVL